MFNAVIIAVVLLFVLAIFRVHIVLAMVLSAVAGGLIGGLGINKTIATFAEGLGAGAEIALSYALLGAFAVALSKTGLPDALAHALIKRSKGSADAASVKKLKGFITLRSCCSRSARKTSCRFTSPSSRSSFRRYSVCLMK